MKKFLLNLLLVGILLIGISAVTVYRIRDIQGDKVGDPTLKQELNNRYTESEADAKFLAKADTIPATSLFYTKTEVDNLVMKLAYSNNKTYSVTNSTAETTVLTFTIPGGLLGANGGLHFYPMYKTNNDGHTKYFKIKINGGVISEIALGAHLSARYFVNFYNKNSTSANESFTNASNTGGTFANTTLALNSYSINTANDITVTITIQNGSTDDTSSLESITVFYYTNTTVY